MAKYVVDTHALLWYLSDSLKSSKHASDALDDTASEFILPIIAVAEACWLVEHGKTSIPGQQQLLSDIDSDPRFKIVPLGTKILTRSLPLSALEMHDRFIVATALVRSAVLITKDEAIRNSGLVTTLW
jgi:PIN domain nuclease of toxin-antitoxin system